MFKRILLPLDGSELAEQALPYVSLLARAAEARVDLLRVIEPLPPASLTGPARESYRQKILAELNRDAEEYLAGVELRLTEQGASVSTTVVQGDPPSQILAAAEDLPETLIAMSTHGRSGVARWVLGSVTDKVLHSAGNPVLVIRCREEPPDLEIELSTIVVPLDGSRLGQQILPHVAGLAKAAKAKVDLVTVIPSAGDTPCHLEILPGSGQGRGQEVMEQAQRFLDRTAEKLRQDGVDVVEEHILQGHPAVAIIDYARNMPGDVVAMSSHGRSGLGRWALGSITDLVAKNSESPVLVIHASELESARG